MAAKVAVDAYREELQQQKEEDPTQQYVPPLHNPNHTQSKIPVHEVEEDGTDNPKWKKSASKYYGRGEAAQIFWEAVFREESSVTIVQLKPRK